MIFNAKYNVIYIYLKSNNINFVELTLPQITYLYCCANSCGLFSAYTDMVSLLLHRIRQEKKHPNEQSISNFCFDSVFDVVNSLCSTENTVNDILSELTAKMKRENYLLHDSILLSSRIKENWINYREKLMENVLPLVVPFLCKNVDKAQVTLCRVLEAFEESRKLHQVSVEFGNRLLATICDSFVAGAVTVVDTLNSPYIWKHLLNAKSFNLFISLMEKYIKQIDLIKLSKKNLVVRSEFDVAYRLFDVTESKTDGDEKEEAHNGQAAVHPVYAFFALTCLWGVKRNDVQQHKRYVAKMVKSILYPNVEIFEKFYGNYDNSLTNMIETYQLFGDIYKHIDDLSVIQGKFYYDSDIWTDSDNLNLFEEFVRDSMGLSLFLPTKVTDAGALSEVAAKTKMKPKSKRAKVIRQAKRAIIDQVHDTTCGCYCDCDLSLCCSCFACYRKRKLAEKNSKDEKKKADIKVLMLGSGDVGKATFAKQIQHIYPSGSEIERQKMEFESEKEASKNVIRMNMVADMAMLVEKGIMYHRENPDAFMEPSYPERYEVPDENAPDGRYIVDIKEGVEAVVNLSKEGFRDVTAQDGDASIDTIQESDEYWIVLGVYIHALWQQPWIRDTYAKRKNLFSSTTNMNEFFDKARDCMSPNYMVSDEDYLKLRVRTTGMKEHRFLYHSAQMKKAYKIKLIYGGGQRNERRKWVDCFDAVSTMIYFCALNHYCEILFEEDTQNAMWESLDLFHGILNGKWFRHSTVIVLLNREDLFRECVRQGYQLKDCFDADTERHPLAEWPGAYDQVNKYTDIEWDPDAYVDLETEVRDNNFNNVVNTQIDFIKEIFFGIAQQNDRKRNGDVYVHVIDVLDKDEVKKMFDTTMINTFQNYILGLM